jgi:hypothetical protein
MDMIRYNGKMGDSLPAWAFTTATGYAIEPNSRKIREFLKEKHGQKRVKIDLAEIRQISPYGSMYTIAVTSTWFTIDKKQYQILQAITMYISNVVSSVVSHDIILGDENGFILEA